MSVELVDYEEEKPKAQNKQSTPLSQMYSEGGYEKVIQTYTDEGLGEYDTLQDYPSVNSRSSVLGMNDKNETLDFEDLFLQKVIIDKVRRPEEDFTWKKFGDFHEVNAIYKQRLGRTILRANGGMNERIAQNTQISQNISSQTLKQSQIGGSGFVSGVKNTVNNLLNQ